MRAEDWKGKQQMENRSGKANGNKKRGVPTLPGSLSSHQASSATPANAHEEWKREGRREAGRTGSLREYLRVGVTQTRKFKREKGKRGGCPGRPAIPYLGLVCCRSVCP